MQATKVWDVVQSPDPHAQQNAQKIIFVCAESVRVIAILLQPVMPSKMKRALDILGVEECNRGFEYARSHADLAYGTPFTDPGKAGADGTLFPPLIAEG
jgi:methionyl-tRNA synthetase